MIETPQGINAEHEAEYLADMLKSRHTAEPWMARDYTLREKPITFVHEGREIRSRRWHIVNDEDGKRIAEIVWSSFSSDWGPVNDYIEARDNVFRIIACVNAMAGIANPAEFVEAAKAAMAEQEAIW